jgi:hypothetical protein
MTRKRTFKRGDTLRTNYKGKHRDQVFKLLNPVARLGNAEGGSWWVKYLASGSKNTLRVDSCERVSPAWIKRFRLSTK